MTDVLERARNQTDPRTGFRYGDFTSVERAEEWREIVDALRDEITRLRASPWVSVEERPVPKNKSVLLRFRHDIFAACDYRLGRLGEPQMNQGLEWRAQCCGRWGTPTHWMPIPPLNQEEV